MKWLQIHFLRDMVLDFISQKSPNFYMEKLDIFEAFNKFA